jgi:choline-sulfatase
VRPLCHTCDLAGLPIPPGLDSRSLVPLLDGEGSQWNNEVVSQFGPTNFMIVRDQLKYQYYGSDVPQVLFDLAQDPGETANLVDGPAYSAHVAAFRARLAALGHGPHADPSYVNGGYTWHVGDSREQ